MATSSVLRRLGKTPQRRALLSLLCVLLLGIVATVTIAFSDSAAEQETPIKDPQDTGGPLDLAMASITQDGNNLVLKFTTRGAWAPGDLSPNAGRLLCFRLFYGDKTTFGSRLCVGSKYGSARLFAVRTDAKGRLDLRMVSAEVTRTDDRSLKARFHPASVDLRMGDYSWQAESSWIDEDACPQATPCTDLLPDGGPVRGRVELISFPRCFGAADRDPERPCTNRALRLSVEPKPEDAVLAPNAPCVRYKETIPYACTFGANPETSSGSIALIGDSHAAHFRGALWVVALAKNWRGWSLVRTGCPLTKADPLLDEPHYSRCLRWNRQLQEWFRKHPEIKTVFLSQHSLARVRPRPGEGHEAAQIAGYVAAWKALPQTVKRIIIIRDVPSNTDLSLGCVQVALENRKRPGIQCAVPRRAALHLDAARVAATRTDSRRVHAIDLTPFMCSPRLCFPVVGGTLVHKDKAHLADVFSTSLGPYLLRAYDRLR